VRARAHSVTRPRQERRRPSQTDAPARPAAPAATGPGAADAPGVLGAVPALDRLIHERLRLGIVSALAVNESLTFNELKHLLGTTDGNLSVHARKLEEAAYVTCSKYFEGRQPRTEYRLTPAGREALQRYLDYMESLIRTARGG
jgi:DNA-binding HxlR family transcriptional regulator